MTIKTIIQKVTEKIAGRPMKGVANVMVYVAALDGKLLPEELEAYRHLAEKQPRSTAETVESDLREALHGAGYLLALAVAADEKTRIDAFVGESLKVLPNDFTQNLDNVRFAVLLWTAMAIADGDYAGIEMKALDALKQRLVDDHLVGAEAVEQSARIFGACSAVDISAGEYVRVAGEHVKEFLMSDCVAEAKSLLV